MTKLFIWLAFLSALVEDAIKDFFSCCKHTTKRECHKREKNFSPDDDIWQDIYGDETKPVKVSNE